MFITNLPPNIQTIIRLKNSDTLEGVLNYVLEEEEFQNFSRLYHSNSNINKPESQNIKPIFHNFPSQPINVQPRQVNQKFPTNRQVFGKPNNQQNVWKQKSANLPKPTPMSGISYQSKPKPMNQMHNTKAHLETPYAAEDYHQTVEDREEIDARLYY
ncbi:hypothetical protein NQ315_002795 [Exocentrus adspersus]|uniref:Uncharacterized protein n=1 Tax=Exocentrus adspersus TaxID=1586481 RepID=A0AAV8VJK1_9CUCU|nr:hypothetical protein NQ315_002795 [Exocentrus adspersus]